MPLGTPVTVSDLRSFFSHVDRHEFEQVEDMLDPDCQIVAPGFSQVGAQFVSLWMAGFFAAFPDLRHEPRRIVSDGQQVAFELQVTGTHTEALSLPDGSTLPPTGRKIDLILAEFWTVAEGRVTNYTVHYDNHSFLAQLGLLS